MKKVLFLGQINKAEFGGSFIKSWEREVGNVHHVEYKRNCRDTSVDAATLEVVNLIAELKPPMVLIWQGNYMREKHSKWLREACDKVNAILVYITLDDPFCYRLGECGAYRYAHVAVTCDYNSKLIYDKLGIKGIFAPPPCSIDNHMLNTHPDNDQLKSEVFFYTGNPYHIPFYQKYNPVNRIDAIKKLIENGVNVTLCTNTNKFDVLSSLPKDQTKNLKKIEGGVIYEKFYEHNKSMLYFNSSVVGPEPIYFNQRVFEILGVGGVQVIDYSKRLEKFYDYFLKYCGVSKENSPFLFYRDINDLVKVVKKALSDPAQIRRRRNAARKMRWYWTFEKLVRRIAFGEKTLFDSYKD